MGDAALTLRPYGVVVAGRLELGLELVLEGGRIVELRPHTGVPDNYVVSPAFVNAHSHLEYRGMLGKLESEEYWPWIREITRLKGEQIPEEVREHTLQAAQENRATGIALIGEHSDRPYSAEALASVGLKGVIFQELITVLEGEGAEAKVRAVRERAARAREVFGGPAYLSPHAYQTVDCATLKEIGASGEPFSIHVAETPIESELTLHGAGPIAEFYAAHSIPFDAPGKTVFDTLDWLGLVRPGAQFVHCCDIDDREIERMAVACVTVAHCPRSNVRLKCPPAPVREMLDAGVKVGLGLDSVASSGAINMFDEMRSALQTSEARGRPVTPEEVWSMATTLGAQSIPGLSLDPWDIAIGSATPLIKINVASAQTTEDLIRGGAPARVEFVGEAEVVGSK